MSNSLKVTLYAVLILMASVSGYFALTSFGRMMSKAGDRTSALEQIEPERRPPAEISDPGTVFPGTNAAVAATTNLPAAETNELSGLLLNTNAPASSNVPLAATTVVVSNTEPAPSKPPKPPAKTGGSYLGIAVVFFIASVIVLGLLVASDVSQYLGNRALKTLYNDEGEGVKNPEYDQAEEVWANGDHLDAIKMMREYLAKNPREQHVSIRIAEIYEKDLNNNLAAALEYEEVLKHKLPAERWGWAAIHLCNLYFRLNQEQKGYVLLRKIVTDYPSTGAAEKARKRLEDVGQAPDNATVSTETQPSPSTPAPASHLPPGFRPKK